MSGHPRTYIKDFILAIFVFALPFFVPHFEATGNVETLVGATSAVFAVVAGFFIADAMSNYLRLQTLISEENASLISIAENSQKIDSNNFSKVHEAIDGYMIAQLNSATLNHIFFTEKQIDLLNQAIDSLEIGPEDEGLFDHVLSMKEKISASRQEMSLAAKRNLTIVHWLTLWTLATLVVITVLAVRDGTLFMNIVAGSMMVGTFAVLILLREMDNNNLLERKLAFENPREVFHAIRKPPYYPSFSPIRARVPNTEGLYRLGKATQGNDFTIDVVKTS